MPQCCCGSSPSPNPGQQHNTKKSLCTLITEASLLEHKKVTHRQQTLTHVQVHKGGLPTAAHRPVQQLLAEGRLACGRVCGVCCVCVCVVHEQPGCGAPACMQRRPQALQHSSQHPTALGGTSSRRCTVHTRPATAKHGGQRGRHMSLTQPHTPTKPHKPMAPPHPLKDTSHITHHCQ